MFTKSSGKMRHLSMAKTEDSTPIGVEIPIPRRSVEKREQVADVQTKDPQNLSGDEQGHRDMPKQKVDAEAPNGGLLDLRENKETPQNPQINQQASGLETIAMATRLAVARKSQSLCDLMTTALDKRKPTHSKSHFKPGSGTTAMSTRSVAAQSRPSSLGPVTTDVSTPLPYAKKSHSSPGLVTRTIETSLSADEKCPTALGIQSAKTSKNEFPSSMVLNENDQSLSDSETKTMATSSAGEITGSILPHFIAPQKSQSRTGPMITATTPLQLGVTSISQSFQSFLPVTKDLDIPLTGATTGQSPSVETTSMKQPVTETVNMEMLVSKKVVRKSQSNCKDMSPEKQRRFSVRLTEGSSKFKDIVVKKKDGFTHIFLSTKSSENNSLNLEVMKEIQIALNKAAADDSKLVLLSAIGSVFCSGLDFDYFMYHLRRNKKRESTKMAEAVKDFVNAFIQFKKPIVVAVNGPAIGLGASILPLCDIIWANEKAWLQTPYTTFGQTPDGCSSFTFPKVMGQAASSEMLLCGRKLTAQEAYQKGLVSQVFWPQTFNQEVMIRVKELASCNKVVLEESKTSLRFSNKLDLEQVSERECRMLKNIWGSEQGMDDLLKYLQNKIEF